MCKCLCGMYIVKLFKTTAQFVKFKFQSVTCFSAIFRLTEGYSVKPCGVPVSYCFCGYWPGFYISA